MPNNRRCFKYIVVQLDYEALDWMLQIDMLTWKVSTICVITMVIKENIQNRPLSLNYCTYIYTEKELYITVNSTMVLVLGHLFYFLKIFL